MDLDLCSRLQPIALVSVGAVFGVSLRFLLLGHFGDVVAILFANVLGCLFLGFLVYEADVVGLVDRSTRLMLTTGVCSSLTTYSTFAMQTAMASGPLATAAIVAGNYGLGLAAVLVGRLLARLVGGVTG